MINRYEVRVSSFPPHGWGQDSGKTRSYFVYDVIEEKVVAKFLCIDTHSQARDEKYTRNDPEHQRIRAFKMCEYMNKVETETIKTMAGTEV